MRFNVLNICVMHYFDYLAPYHIGEASCRGTAEIGGGRQETNDGIFVISSPLWR